MARDLIYTKTLRVYVSIETDADIMYWQGQLTKLHVSPSLKTRKIITDSLLGFEVPRDFSIPENPEEHLIGAESTANFNIKMEETSHIKIKEIADAISEQTKNYTSVSKLVKCLIRMSFKEQTEKTMLMNNPYSMYDLFCKLNRGASIVPLTSETTSNTQPNIVTKEQVQIVPAKRTETTNQEAKPEPMVEKPIKAEPIEDIDSETAEARKILEMMDSQEPELSGIPINSKTKAPTKVHIKTGKAKLYD